MSWFLGIFGTLQLASTRTRIRGVFDDTRFTQRYEALAADADSVAIRWEDTQVTGRWCIQQVHSEGIDRYWVTLGGNREWFRRIHPPRRPGCDSADKSAGRTQRSPAIRRLQTRGATDGGP